jgi:hypothetical protein
MVPDTFSSRSPYPGTSTATHSRVAFIVGDFFGSVIVSPWLFYVRYSALGINIHPEIA